MRNRSADDDRVERNRSARRSFGEAARSQAGREAVALLFTGLAAHLPIRRLLDGDGSGDDAGEENVTIADHPEAEAPHYEDWTVEPIATELPWTDGTLDHSFGTTFGEGIWFEPTEPIVESDLLPDHSSNLGPGPDALTETDLGSGIDWGSG